MATEGIQGMALAQPSRKRKKKRRKKKKRKQGQVAPAPPPAAPGYKHILGWDDSAGDGLEIGRVHV